MPSKKLLLAALIVFILLGVYVGVKWQKHSIGILGASTRNNGPFDHTLVFIGDSMTEYLGNFDELRGYLKKAYPNKNFLLLNYGYSATNILSLPDRIDKDSTHSGRVFEAVNKIPFDLIFIESMGNNPLSQYPLEEGLEKQTEALDKVVALLTSKHPKSKIVFIATIAPNRHRYGEGRINLSTDEREKWADERMAYIKNHIRYAREHNIPLINIFQDSQANGQGNSDYISTNDFIHPSPNGVYFISQKIADFISKSNLVR